MMPRSSSGEFQERSSPCVAVNTPPSGGPTSSPKISVTPSFCSPWWRAMRMACAMLAMSAASLGRIRGRQAVGEHVLPDRLDGRERLLLDLLVRRVERRRLGGPDFLQSVGLRQAAGDQVL